MTPTSERSGVALVSGGDPDNDPVLERFLRASPLDGARRFRTRDLNDVERAIREGEVTRVIFARLEDLMEGCWDEQVRLDEWQRAGARIEIAEPAGLDAQRVAGAVYESWRRWNRARRRRLAIAGSVLSVIAVGAAFAMCWAIR